MKIKRSATQPVKKSAPKAAAPTKKRDIKAKAKDDDDKNKVVHKGTVTNGVIVDRLAPNAS